MSERIGIFGTSGMAREAGDVAWAVGLEPFYIARDDQELKKWSGVDEVILESEIDKVRHHSFVIGIGDNIIRHKIASRFSEMLHFSNLIHPSATFGYKQREVVDTGRGVIIAAGARLTSNISMGNFVLVNQNATIAHDCIIESFVHVAPGANISGNVHLEEGAWVGAGAVINQGNDIEKRVVGRNAMVGSGAVVIADCEPETVYAGVPAKRLK
jgi:sugar O-acyltransferase (sialic acid O-acetyltransferase NeuD family)